MKFIGYHGTSKKSGKEILDTSKFYISNKTNWLGAGIYFFNENQVDPKTIASEEAKNWALKVKRYEEYMVLKVRIEVTSYIDIWNEPTHEKIYKSIKRKMEEQYKERYGSLKNFQESTIYEKILEKGFKLILAPINASKQKYISYSIGKIQLQLVVRDNSYIKEIKEVK